VATIHAFMSKGGDVEVNEEYWTAVKCTTETEYTLLHTTTI